MFHDHFFGLEGEGLDESEVGVSSEGSEDPEEGFFILVVGLGRDVKVLEVALAMEGDLAGLDFAIFLVDFVADEDDGDVVADSSEVLVPFGHVFVGDSGGDVEHDDACVSSDVVALSEAS